MPLPATAFSELFQFAYIVRDMKEAIDAFATQHGVSGFTPAIYDLNLSYPAAKVSILVGLTWVDDHEIELIQPIVDETGIYKNAIPHEPANLKLHHFAARVPGSIEDWESFRAKVGDERIVLAGGREGMRFIYVDAQRSTGHYLEYIWQSPEYLAKNPARVPPSRRSIQK